MTNVHDVLNAIEEADSPGNALVAAYKTVYPNFDDLPGPIPFGRANRETNDKILTALMDKFPGERVGVGFMWINNGFSVDETVENGLILRGTD